MCLIILSICPCGINEVYLISSLFLSAWRPAEGGQGGELEPAPRSRESLWLLLTNTHPACPGRVRQLSSSSITQLVTLTPPPHHTRTHTRTHTHTHTHTLSLSRWEWIHMFCVQKLLKQNSQTHGFSQVLMICGTKESILEHLWTVAVLLFFFFICTTAKLWISNLLILMKWFYIWLSNKAANKRRGCCYMSSKVLLSNRLWGVCGFLRLRKPQFLFLGGSPERNQPEKVTYHLLSELGCNCLPPENV